MCLLPVRLMQASSKKFFEYCTDHGLGIGRNNFSMQYDTNIPRQVGLAGSSAIVYSCIVTFTSNLTEQLLVIYRSVLTEIACDYRKR